MSENLDIRSDRALTLGSGCQFAFIRRNDTIVPVLMLTGINKQGIDGARVGDPMARPRVGIIVSQQDANSAELHTKFKQPPVLLTSSEASPTDWLTLDYETDKLVYPRIFIKSLQVRTDSDSLMLKYEQYNQNQESNKIVNYNVLTPYEDYSILTRSLDQEYVITIKPEVVLKNGIMGTLSGVIQPKQAIINYSISNADTSIYLDAIEVLKQNSQPKVSYEVKPAIYDPKYYSMLYNKLGNIVRINDEDLKFKNVLGYVSGLTLDLDNPDNDSIEIKNYKTKFEDLFSTITAQTQQMKKNNNLFEAISNAFTSDGDLSEEILQSSIMKVDLDYAFNNGKLTIDEHNGIWGSSDTGVVAFRGGGIFTSTQQDAEGNWKWNTGITPEGINANLITSGQLDTNLIKIYSGTNLRFQMNGDGIFAYKSKLIDRNQNNQHPGGQDIVAANSTDGNQYVVFNDNGLALLAKQHALVLDSNKNSYKEVLSDDDKKNYGLRGIHEIKRVEVSWDGFILRNWHNERVFYANPDTGNLTLVHIDARDGAIGAWSFDGNKMWADSTVDNEGNYTTFVALNAGGSDRDLLVHRDGTSYKNSKNQNLIVSTKDYAFWAGRPNPEQAPFSIQKNGYLKATSGKIGGWTIASTYLTSDSITLSSYDETITAKFTEAQVDAQGNIIIDSSGNTQVTTTDRELTTALWVHGYKITKQNGQNKKDLTKDKNFSVFQIGADGQLYAKDLWWITNDPKTGRIISYERVSDRIREAYNKAVEAYRYADKVWGAINGSMVTSIWTGSKEGNIVNINYKKYNDSTTHSFSFSVD